MTLASVNTCTGCGACCVVCQHQAITLQRNDEGFLYPVVNPGNCVHCGRCSKQCPVLSAIASPAAPLSCFASQAKDRSLLKRSSSGGVFSILARQILNQNGIIYGCAFNDQFQALHIRIDRHAELHRLQGSKYVQSDLSGILSVLLQDIRQGRLVFFSGTPCQVAGIRGLAQNSKQLITLEVICHGVPSPLVWEYYLNALKKNGTSITSISMRSKTISWRNFSFAYTADGKIQEEVFSENSYMQAFLGNLCLRRCCYQCKFKNGASGADITLGDFWGIENTGIPIDSNQGTSAVIVHSEKGKQLNDVCRSHMIYESCRLEQITPNNFYNKTAICPPFRDLFMSKIQKKDFSQWTQTCLKGSLKHRIFRKITRFVKALF